MKLFAATVAAAVAQGFKRSSEQIEESFVIVPEGYGGSFEGFNATQVVLENAEDDLFREFEDEFYAVDVDVMSRSQFTEEEKKNDPKIQAHQKHDRVPPANQTLR